jgi:hypothetical protein
VTIRFGAALCAVMIACRVTEPDDRRCQQSFEFGNDGCADVEGEVRGVDSERLSGAQVVVFERSGQGYGTNTVPTTTDAQGIFRLRITCILGCPSDTVTYWIHASLDGISDSVATSLAFARVGEVPQPKVVQVTLRAR